MKSRITTVVLAALAGVAGGALSTRLVSAPPVYAQQPPQVVQAKSFVLYDASGRKRGEWIIDPSGEPVLQLFDEQGKLIWDTTSKPKMRPLTTR